MMYRISEEEGGDYLTADGRRCALHCCRRIRTRDGVNEGWTAFSTFADCLEEWGLTYAPLSELAPENRP